MEIIVFALIAYVGYRLIKTGLISKSIVATEIQHRFSFLERNSFFKFEGDVNREAQAYIEKYWDSIAGIRKQKPHLLILTSVILVHAARDLHNSDNPNADFVLMTLGNVLNDIKTVIRTPSPAEGEIVLTALDIFIRISSVRNSQIKGIEGLASPE